MGRSPKPFPPRLDLRLLPFYYGLCVDVLLDGCWREGVFFDHEERPASRTVRIFFPEESRELKVPISSVRITQDLDKATQKWNPRGTWLFVELIEEFEQQSPLFLSLQQVWCDVLAKDGFKNVNNWAFCQRDVWKPLILEAFKDNVKLFVQEFFLQPECSSEDLVEHNFGSEGDGHFSMISDAEIDDHEGVFGSEKVKSCARKDDPDEDLKGPKTSSTLSDPQVNKEVPKIKFPSFCKEFILEPEYCPQALVDYCEFCSQHSEAKKNDFIQSPNQPKARNLQLKAKKHLIAAGWSIYYVRKGNLKEELRYGSPCRKQFNSLIQACRFYFGGKDSTFSSRNLKSSIIVGQAQSNEASEELPEKPADTVDIPKKRKIDALQVDDEKLETPRKLGNDLLTRAMRSGQHSWSHQAIVLALPSQVCHNVTMDRA